jgi:hypothetical protein
LRAYGRSAQARTHIGGTQVAAIGLSCRGTDLAALQGTVRKNSVVEFALGIETGTQIRIK